MTLKSSLIVALIGILTLTILIQTWRIEYLETDRTNLRTEIATLEIEAKALNERYQDASTSAAQNMQKAQLQDEMVMTIHVPKFCDEAIEWAIIQAKGF